MWGGGGGGGGLVVWWFRKFMGDLEGRRRVGVEGGLREVIGSLLGCRLCLFEFK